MSLISSGLYGIVPWLVASAADILVWGWLLDRVIRRRGDQSGTRTLFLVIGFTLGLAVGLAALTTNANLAVLFISIWLGGLAMAAPIGQPHPADWHRSGECAVDRRTRSSGITR